MTASATMPSGEAVAAAAAGKLPNPDEPHAAGSGGLKWLCAGVLGANDGIVAGIVVGVAGAANARGPIFTAGLAGLVAGAVSMSLGEYVSVSSQRDTEAALIAEERTQLTETPGEELAELTRCRRRRGLSAGTAATVAAELTAHNALAAHLDAELNIDLDDLANPVQAAASALSFLRRRAAAAGGNPAAAARVAAAGGRAGRARDHRGGLRADRRGDRGVGRCCGY